MVLGCHGFEVWKHWVMCCFKGFVIRNMSTFTQSLRRSFIEFHRGVPLYCICNSHGHIYKVYLYSRTLPAALVRRMNLSIVFRHIHFFELILKFFSWHKIQIAQFQGLSYSAAFFLPSSWCLAFLLGENSGTYFIRCEGFLTFPPNSEPAEPLLNIHLRPQRVETSFLQSRSVLSGAISLLKSIDFFYHEIKPY